MKAPDKLFVSNDPFGFMSTYYIENHPPYGEEYIRKDAMLAFLNERRKGLTSGDSFVAGERKMLKEIIEKIESL